MQGTVLMPQNPQHGFPPISGSIVNDMDSPPPLSKESLANRSDSGIFSTTNTTIEHGESSKPPSETYDTDDRSECSSPERKFLCPICETMLTSQHDFTLHIRSHNNHAEPQDVDKGYTCRICFKVLSSSSSLDRHVLVHSGERPFRCKYCGDSFTTNGNMHRHVRTHFQKPGENSCESDASSESAAECNNNRVEKRKRDEEEEEGGGEKRAKSSLECPVCERADFDSAAVLETHLGDNHPDYPAKCGQCQQVFLNNKLLTAHKAVGHGGAWSRPPVVGFKDLTFVDFSSEKFAVIARRECEANVHQAAAAAALKFQCERCGRAFPCSTSLGTHERGCAAPGGGAAERADVAVSRPEIKRMDFFSGLHLQRQQHHQVDAAHDLADIQSILSNINLKKQVGEQRVGEQEEESQDVFAVEFRRMKMRGEFPCRLCSAVFPNLRALKGHNRAHLNGGAPDGAYHCNMCPHSSADKAALVRHMRTHNGDRPYECALCNYAFTTKANCERHLRNRHAKATRDDVKKAIIYHPAEDPTNDDLHKLPPKEEPAAGDRLRCSTPKRPGEKAPAAPPPPRLDFRPSPPPPPAKIQVKSLEALRHAAAATVDDDSEEEAYAEDEPLDLVLDLSKKKPTRPYDDEEPQDLTKKSPPTPPQLQLFTQQLYATQLALYRSGFPAWPAFPLNGLLFPALPPSPQEMRERMQRFQMCGGSVETLPQDLVHSPPTSLKMVPRNGAETAPQDLGHSLTSLKMMSRNGVPADPVGGLHETAPQDLGHSLTSLKMMSRNGVPADPVGGLPEAVPQDLVHSPASVKMVIKNGVLMPKQKQRRYRTERPFTCEHCSARFTLRSNMERHVKQQHPQYWSQRQRGNVGNPGKKPQAPPCDFAVPPNVLDEKIKFALLAQQLHHMRRREEEEEEEDCDLVIDEAEEEEEQRRAYPSRILEERLGGRNEEGADLVPVARLLDDASHQQFNEFFKRNGEEAEVGIGSEEDEEGLVASGSTSEENVSGTDENKSESDAVQPVKKKSAYSLAPNRVSCPYCSRKFPWTSSLRRHILTHTGQKPFKCLHCPLLFTTKSNCDRHLLRKHGSHVGRDPPDGAAPHHLGRNVPERPFKCSSCPSSTFASYSNLKKHIGCKHSTEEVRAQGYEAGSSEEEPNQAGVAAAASAELPFKCHLCEGSFSERHDALEHIRERHAAEYELLVAKNALEEEASQLEEEEQPRGKFPDYSNRKVVCAFCVRRFWSAEDLRRHMRTHTGERPFSCDICRRKFTLKHSMLRHRKKHQEAANNNNNSDEDAVDNAAAAGGDSDGGDLISNLLGLRDGSIIDKVLAASADDAAKLLGVRNGIKE